DPVPGGGNGLHITDLAGHQDVWISTDLQMAGSFLGFAPMGDNDWVSGDRLFFVAPHGLSGAGSSPGLYTAPFIDNGKGGKRMAGDVDVADVRDGVVGWVTTSGQVFTESVAGGSPHRIDVPLDEGCRVLRTSTLRNDRPFVVSRSMVALTERCADGGD